jgi:hypothetical protein
MDTKLTLKLDRDVIERTKQYAEQRGVSLSEMVETYFTGLTRSASTARREPTGIVAELTGIARGVKGVKIDDSAESYADYLAAKYS